MSTIVAGVDTDTDRARALANGILALPGVEDAEVVLVHAFHENPEGASVDQVGAVRRARELLADAGVEVILDETSGETAEALLDVADEHDADLLAVAGRKRSPTGKAVFGSVAQAVMLDAPCPVTFVRGDNGDEA